MEKLRINKHKESVIDLSSSDILKVDIATIGHYTEFGFIDPGIRSMFPEQGKFFGSAVTVRVPAQESKAVHVAVSMLSEGDVLVIDRCGDTSHAAVGEMVALCAATRKASAIVVDGSITDYEAISKMDIPVYATGVSALTTKFVVDCGEINYDICCGGVPVHPGDLIMGDRNGVLVLRPFEVDELISLALADQGDEANDKEKVLNGRTLQELYVPEYPL